jgi:hypothetical protein
MTIRVTLVAALVLTAALPVPGRGHEGPGARVAGFSRDLIARIDLHLGLDRMGNRPHPRVCVAQGASGAVPTHGPSRPGLATECLSEPAGACQSPTKPVRGGVGNTQETVLLDVLAPYAG